MTPRIGTAGWNIARDSAAAFPAEGTALERYAARFNCAEINSSFHRPHRVATWEKWRDSVPADFRFSAKLPKTISHQAKLYDCTEAVVEFLAQAHALGEKLGALLVQLPPRLEFDRAVARRFFADLSVRSPAAIACEPRNASWFTPEADALLAERDIARVAADPALSQAAGAPGGSPGLAYWRLHGSPVMYRSSYADRIAEYAQRLTTIAKSQRWCIFDNTASSAATSDALALLAALEG